MDLSWISIVDTTVKIGLGASISAVAGYVVLCKSNTHDRAKEARQRFFQLQEERKLKYAELLTQSQRLIQSSLLKATQPDSNELMDYFRAYNDVQIISTDELANVADSMVQSVAEFALLRKNEQERAILDGTLRIARDKVIYFRKFARDELTKSSAKSYDS